MDYASLAELVEWHIASQTDGLVILGTTGESPTIESAERRQIVQRVINQVHARIPVIVGTGSNSTSTHHPAHSTGHGNGRGCHADRDPLL